MGLTWRLPLAGLVAFSHLQFSQIRGRQPYLIVRKILYVIAEYRLEVRVACDLAPDVANEPAEAGALNAQLSTVAVELFGMGITPCHHGGALGDAHIRLSQPHGRFLASRVSPLIAAWKSFASGG